MSLRNNTYLKTTAVILLVFSLLLATGCNRESDAEKAARVRGEYLETLTALSAENQSVLEELKGETFFCENNETTAYCIVQLCSGSRNG